MNPRIVLLHATPVAMQPVPSDGDTVGEIMFRGNITMSGYLKNPTATDDAFAGGWFHTGDRRKVIPAVRYYDRYLGSHLRIYRFVINTSFVFPVIKAPAFG